MKKQRDAGFPGSRPRLAIVVSHPIQHFCPMYREIANDGRVELLVVFAERGAAAAFDSDFGRVVGWQDDLLDGYEHTVLSAAPAARSKAVLSALKSFAPDAVYVHGYALPYLRAAMRWANRAGIPVLMSTDSELLHPRPLHVRALKHILLPRILNQVELLLTVGDENERYFAHYGVGPERFRRVPFSIDSAAYDRVLEHRDRARSELRRTLGISGDTVAILTVGKLIPRKGHADLIQAFASAIASARTPAVLLIAGDGPERARLEELAKPLGPSVRLVGFVGVDELPEYYCAADIYAHPSSFDPHPLAISEAVYCGLPVVVSDRVGSVGPTDDVQQGRNAWVYANGDVPALSKILTDLIDDPAIRARASAISQELGKMHASSHAAKRFVDGVLHAMTARKRRP